MTRIKAVLFDYGGTIDADGIAWRDRFYSLYKKAGLKTDPETFAKAFYKSDDNLPTRFDLSNKGLEETVRLQVDCVVKTLSQSDRALPRGSAASEAMGAADQMASRVTEAFVAQSREAFTRNRPLLEALSKRYRLGIVSNFYGNLERILSGEGLLPLFGAVADSRVVGVEKPEPAIFRHALDRLGAAPEEAVMVGDSLPRDIRGAAELGMRQVFLAGPNRPADPSFPKAHLIRKLTELEDILLKEKAAL